MPDLMSEEESDYCVKVVHDLRMQVHHCNVYIHRIDARLGDELSPPWPGEYKNLASRKEQVMSRRRCCAKLIKDIREVLVEPPSLESRVFGYINCMFSFRFI